MSSSRTYILNGHLFFSCSSKFGGGGLCGLIRDNNTAADPHGSYPPGSMNVSNFLISEMSGYYFLKWDVVARCYFGRRKSYRHVEPDGWECWFCGQWSFEQKVITNLLSHL